MGKIITGEEADLFKHLDESLALIGKISKKQLVTISKHGHRIDKALATLLKDERGFRLVFNDSTPYRFELGDIPNIQITTSAADVTADNLFINSISGEMASGRIISFKTNTFIAAQSKYFRLIIPLKETPDFFEHIQNTWYKTKRRSSASCIVVRYEDFDFDLFIYDDRKSGTQYLVLDANKQLTLASFNDYCFSTIVAFAYITGYMPQDEGFFLSFDDNNHKAPSGIFYSELRPSIKTHYTPATANAFGILKHTTLSEKEKDTIHRTLRKLKREEFSALCRRAYGSLEFSSILLLIVESTASSLLVMPACLSIALEGVTAMIAGENEDKMNPIPDKSAAKKLVKDIKAVLESYSGPISPDGRTILTKKIDGLNQATNTDKLTKPFAILKIKLNADDKKAISHRNDFLHGRITLTGDQSVDSLNMEIYSIALRLYTLVSMLILKSVGYDSKVINYPKLNESMFIKKNEEPFFRAL